MTSRLRPTPPPVVHGLLTASGASLRADKHGDAFELGVDDRENLYVVLVSVEGPSHEASRVLEAALGLIRAGAPVQRIVASLEAAGVGLPSGVGALILRFHQPGSRVELMNAGMPPIACLLPGQRVVMHPARSAAIGRGFRHVHPYELLPLLWGSVWVVASPGLAGSGDAAVAQLLDAPGLKDPALVASRPSEAVRDAVQVLLGSQTPAARDASLIVVDSSRRSRAAHKRIPGTGGPV